MSITGRLNEVLDALEQQESTLLAWGDTGASFTEQEVFAVILSLFPDEDEEELFDELLSRVMLYEVCGTGSDELRYRTRMAESVHLQRNSRQWFHGQELAASRSLVSDYRFHLQRRRFPARSVSLETLQSDFLQDSTVNEAEIRALEIQVGNFQLAAFQARATARVIDRFIDRPDPKRAATASIICAGTGSGKTMAFYLPALSVLVREIARNSEDRVRVLAIYPRRELLKDQLNETFWQCRKLDAYLKNRAGRGIRVGAFFGSTPRSAACALKPGRSECDYDLIRCPDAACKGSMVWLQQDIKKNNEVLRCNACGKHTESGDVRLTRRSLVDNPPDILFTTTEMLNQQMCNPKRRHLFGIGQNANVSLVLLDEVHTYSGNQGAQAAYLLRRWMKLARSSPHFVGLSATLLDAENYFSRLTGAHIQNVTKIEPSADEFVEESSEYFLMLRGDPVSQTALLSTTIQSVMLTRRLLDHGNLKVSEGMWGTKSFVFTDNLDVVNRLYWQMWDAEGWQQRSGNRMPTADGPLAKLRNPMKFPSRMQLQEFGQDWGIAQEIGFSLDESDQASVTRTSSQDAGVVSDSDVVVATASLEVGFNDTEVGAVLQHKAPRDMATFLQRKGRAGRTRKMRPWTIVVVSDFGRDRVAFQHYEKFVDPEIRLQRLPLGNGHIHKMQAAMAVLDWLSIRAGASCWLILNQPSEKRYANDLKNLGLWVRRCIESEQTQGELVRHIQWSLQLDQKELERVLWQPPRSIFLEFLPIMRRRIETQWAVWNSCRNEVEMWAEMNRSWRSPIPEFIPDNFFSDLSLPSLNVVLQTSTDKVRREGMSFFQGLGEFAPGRVSRRFSDRSSWGADWCIPAHWDFSAESGDTFRFEIEEAFGLGRSDLGLLPKSMNCDEDVRLWQPHDIYCKKIPGNGAVTDRSNSAIEWCSLFIPPKGVISNEVPGRSSWGDYLEDVRFYSHSTLTQLEVIRFSLKSKAEIGLRGGKRLKQEFVWHDSGKPTAIGTKLWVDAARFQFRVGDDNLREIVEAEELEHLLRVPLLQDVLREDPFFDGNRFRADWILECFIACVAVQVVVGGGGVRESITTIFHGDAIIPLRKIPGYLFQGGLYPEDDEGEWKVEDDEKSDLKLLAELSELLINPALLALLEECGGLLYESLWSHEAFPAWLKNVMGNSLAGGLQQAFNAILPDIDENAVHFDPIQEVGSIVVWVTEQESGGNGSLVSFQRRYQEDPLSVLNVLSHCFEPSDYEVLDTDLQRVLRDCMQGELATSFSRLREAEGFAQRQEANTHLREALVRANIRHTHSFMNVLFSRLLRPGSSADTDQDIYRHICDWQNLENKLGFEVPLNIASFVLSGGDVGFESARRVYGSSCRIQASLWSRGNVVRQGALSFYNPFCRENVRTERCLVEAICERKVSSVDANASGDWLMEVHRHLEKGGSVDVLVSRDDPKLFRDVLLTTQVRAMDAFGLFFYPRVQSVRADLSNHVIRFEFAEFVQ